MYCLPRRALTLCLQLCMGIQPDARFPARSAVALPATLYGHFTQAIYRNRAIEASTGTSYRPWCAVRQVELEAIGEEKAKVGRCRWTLSYPR